jgi:hypothetical protein
VINTTLAQLALRNRLLGLSIASTGSATLVATTTGYTRAAGSFLTDLFAPSMEITPTGFPENPVDVLIGVTATTLTTANAHAAAVSGAARTIAAKLPVGRAFENIVFSPTTGRPWIEEDFVPNGSALRTFAGDGGQLEDRGLYVVKYYGLSNLPNVNPPAGAGISAIRRATDAIKALYSPGTRFTLSDATVLRIRSDVAPIAGQMIPLENGYSAVTITIPWSLRSRNAAVSV